MLDRVQVMAETESLTDGLGCIKVFAVEPVWRINGKTINLQSVVGMWNQIGASGHTTGCGCEVK